MSEQQITDFLTNRIVDQMVTFLIEDRNIGIEQALEIVYSSKTYERLMMKDNYLVSQSPGYVFSYLEEELKEK